MPLCTVILCQLAIIQQRASEVAKYATKDFYLCFHSSTDISIIVQLFTFYVRYQQNFNENFNANFAVNLAVDI